MKLNKNNCVATTFDYANEKECSLTAYLDDFTNRINVIEVPKIWREDGKSYRVTFVTIFDADYDVVIRAPFGCEINSHAKIERY